MDFLYIIVMVACSLITAVSGRCDIAGASKCSGEGIPTCETLPAIEQCLNRFAPDCAGDSTFQQIQAGLAAFKPQCSGGASGCDVMKLSQCIQPLQASIGQLSSGSPPNAETLQAMCSGYNQFKACKPASCDNSPLLQSMTSSMAVLDSSCGGSGGGSAGGSSGSSGDCNMQELNTCLQPFNAAMSSMPQDGSMPSGKALDSLCSSTGRRPEELMPWRIVRCPSVNNSLVIATPPERTYKSFKSCLPPACVNSAAIKGMQQQSDIFDQMCREGCKISEIMKCVRPLMDLKGDKMASLEFNSALISSVCPLYSTYKTCMDAAVDESCMKNNQFKAMADNLEKSDKVHKYLCVTKKAEIMKHKDCFDKPEVGRIMKECYSNHTESMIMQIADPQSDSKPSDSKKCNAINMEATCVRDGIGETCSENTKDTLYKIGREGSMILTDLSTCDDGTSGSDKIQMSFWATILLIAGAMMF